MTKTISVIFDGQVLRPEEPLDIAPNTRLTVTVSTDEKVKEPRKSFLDTAAGLKLSGPADWSERLDEYLYGNGREEDE